MPARALDDQDVIEAEVGDAGGVEGAHGYAPCS